jgi:hypothetical protein
MAVIIAVYLRVPVLAVASALALVAAHGVRLLLPNDSFPGSAWQRAAKDSPSMLFILHFAMSSPRQLACGIRQRSPRRSPFFDNLVLPPFCPRRPQVSRVRDHETINATGRSPRFSLYHDPRPLGLCQTKASVDPSRCPWSVRGRPAYRAAWRSVRARTRNWRTTSRPRFRQAHPSTRSVGL